MSLEEFNFEALTFLLYFGLTVFCLGMVSTDKHVDKPGHGREDERGGGASPLKSAGKSRLIWSTVSVVSINSAMSVEGDRKSLLIFSYLKNCKVRNRDSNSFS